MARGLLPIVLMARALWSGALSFGLVNVPVKMYRATTSAAGRTISFHQIHKECGTRIQHKRWCPYDEREVPWEEVEKGYEFAKGRYAILTEEDLAELPKEDKAAIAIADFVVESEIDPMLYDTTYYLAPDGPPRAYALLHRALIDSEKVAIAKVMLRTRSHLAVVRAKPDRLVLETMYFADEISDAEDIPGVPDSVKLPEREVEMAERLIDSMTTKFAHDKYKDDYTDAVRKVIEQKIEGEEVTAPPPLQAQPSGVIDLMEALRRSVEQAGDGKGHKAAHEEKAATHKRAKSTPHRREAAEPTPRSKERASTRAAAGSHAKASRSHKRAS